MGSTTTDEPTREPGGDPAGIPPPRQVVEIRTRSDRAFRGLAGAAGTFTLILLVLIGLFLLIGAWPALRETGLSFFTETEWLPPPQGTTFGVAALLYWTVVIAVIALTIAVPVSIAAALFITEFAPRAIRGPLTSLVDLLAAVPSLIYGMWGAEYLRPRMVGISEWLADHLGFLPIFKPTSETPFYGPSAFVAGVVVSLMVVPICTSVMREVFTQVPPGEKEGALALGGTRWGMIRAVVLPFGRGGIIGGSMLGLGRALGETIAILLIISPITLIRPNVIEQGANSIAAWIALRFGESGEFALSALMAAGFVLFVVTLLVNTAAASIIAKSRSGSGVDLMAPPTATEDAEARSAGLVPLRPRSMNTKDIVILVGAALSSLALTWLLYSQLLPFQGIQGFIVIWGVSFLAMYYGAVRETDGPVIARDRTMAALVTVTTIAIVIPLVVIVVYVTLKGLRYLRPAFFTTTMADVGPLSPPTETGGLHAIVGTLEQVGIATLITVPLGVMTAVYLNEVRGRLQRPVRIFVDAMSGVPSIVAGLFIYTTIVIRIEMFSGFAAALALSILMLPTVTRTAEVVLRLVPDGLREASLALGSSQWKTVWRVVLPTARTGVVTAIILGVARVVGETAPLIMTTFGSATMNVNPFSEPQAALPLTAFQLFQSSQLADVDRAWVFAFVLIALVLILFVTARLLGRRGVVRA